MKKKEVIVFFTGGLDSTYLIYKNLEAGNTVKPVYVEILNNKNKTLVEKQNIDILLKKFKEDYGYDNIRHVDYITEIGVNWGTSLHYTQPYLWLMNAIMIDTNGYDEIQLAYVLNDDAVSFVDDIKKIYNNKLFDNFVSSDRRNKLKFPLLKVSKNEIVKELPEKYLKYVNSCENPEIEKTRFRYKYSGGEFLISYKPCKNCVPCERLKNNKYFYSSILKKKYNTTENRKVLASSIMYDAMPMSDEPEPFYDKVKAG